MAASSIKTYYGRPRHRRLAARKGAAIGCCWAALCLRLWHYPIILSETQEIPRRCHSPLRNCGLDRRFPRRFADFLKISCVPNSMFSTSILVVNSYPSHFCIQQLGLKCIGRSNSNLSTSSSSAFERPVARDAAARSAAGSKILNN